MSPEEWKPNPYLRASDHHGLRTRSSTDRRPTGHAGEGIGGPRPAPGGLSRRLDSAFSCPRTPRLHSQSPPRASRLPLPRSESPCVVLLPLTQNAIGTGPSSYSAPTGAPTPLCDFHGLFHSSKGARGPTVNLGNNPASLPDSSRTL